MQFPTSSYNKLMYRWMSTALALFLLATPASAQPDVSAEDALKIGIERLQRAEHVEALGYFDKALDSYAGAQRLDAARGAYMDLFVSNRTYANALMKAFKTWVEKHRTDAAGLDPSVFAAFDAWVHERDALAAATINLVHNSPDWK
jgi:hypothetical protein